MAQNHQYIKKRFKVILPREWNNRQKGQFWEDIAAPLFRQQRWKVLQDVEFEGMQTDIYVKNSDTDEKGLVECKFQKDAIDAPTIEKLIGQVVIRKCKYAYLLSTSELASTSKAIIEDFEDEKIKLVFWGPERLAEVFMDIKGISIPDIYQKGIGRVESITLLVTHTKDFFWVAEEIGEDGYPYRAIIFPITDNYFPVEEWKKYFLTHELNWGGLDIDVITKTEIRYKDNLQSQHTLKIDKLIVSKINEADSFDDYHHPSRPQDFFGRSETQDKFWNFIKNVRNDKTQLRVVCFPGSTGIGKSSLVLKLAAECCLQKEYKDSFYIYHVDVTSVNADRAMFFIIGVITKALQEAVDNGFIEIANHKILIESTEPPFFSSRSIQLAVENLKVNRRVMIIFFDQFEEILTKDSLATLYELFQTAAYEVDSLKENIVLGFCWRTDINLPIQHRAYHTWHELQRIRKDIDFNEFSYQDSLKLLHGFDEYLKQEGKPLDPKIKRWLAENCQNLPWLLKKLCGDIYNQNIDGSEITSKNKKVITKFDIKRIFDADIQRYIKNKDYHTCLQYIAKQSPVPISDVCSKFDPDVINRLVRSKLVIQTGQNYKIYWDIFREYLLDGTLPTIIISYKPRTRISTLFRIFRLLKPSATKLQLVQNSGYEKGTVDNAIQDMQNFLQVEKYRDTDIITAPEYLIKLKDEELSEHLAEQIEAHIIIREIYEKIKPDEWIWYEEFKELWKKFEPDEGKLKPATKKDYTSRMLSWFCFAGLLEIRQDWLIARPIRPRQGKQKGKLSECNFDKPRASKSRINPGQLSLFDILE
ncbi:restriction endonuclease [Nostoc sp.]|uniref:restriction endonuclease n=1 Tax=Nostoc sp. TaxID=1180 RepID=UPI002FFB6E21